MDSTVATFRASLLFMACAIIDSLFLIAIGLLVGIDLVILLPCSLVLASIWILIVYRRIDSFILKRIHAIPAKLGNYPGFQNLVEGVCISYGFRKP